jgi:hypothetical protein
VPFHQEKLWLEECPKPLREMLLPWLLLDDELRDWFTRLTASLLGLLAVSVLFCGSLVQLPPWK